MPAGIGKWFDKLTMSGLLTVPLILSLSKDAYRNRERWFDKLTMSGLLPFEGIVAL